MQEKGTTSESGQVLVILVLAIVGLLAFTALAIDGGLIYADRRGAQNAADAAVLAGGYRIANTLDDFTLNYNIDYAFWNCTQVDAITNEFAILEGTQQAAANGYPIPGLFDSSLEMPCEPGENADGYTDKYVDANAIINSEVNTAFLHFAFEGLVHNTVQAISRVRPRMPLAFGYPVYAHRDSCSGSSGGIHFAGGGLSVLINAGPNYGYGMMSDGCIDASGTTVAVTNDGEVNYVNGGAPGGSIDPAPIQQPNGLPIWSLLLNELNCTEIYPSSSTVSGAIISPGRYDNGITVETGDVLTLEPGLYCLGDSFTVNAGGKVSGNGVTLYLQSGNFVSNGTADIRLNAPNFAMSVDDGFPGMLIYMEASNAGQISLLGHWTAADNHSYYYGTIYAAHPDSVINVSGSGNQMTDYNVQLIGGRVNFAGTTPIVISTIYDPPNSSNVNIYMLPARLTLER